MVRRLALFALVAVLPGCDLAFSLNRTKLPTVCGAFGDEREVRFGDELADITDFTFDGPRTRGFVRATQGARTGPTPVVFDAGAKRWDYDAAFEANWSVLQNNEMVRVARMARDNELYVAQQLTTPSPALHVFHYGFVGGNWVPIEQTEIARTSNSDAVPGGELSTPNSDFLPIFRFDKVTEVRSVAIALHAPGAMMWEDVEKVGGESSTQTINDQHQAWSGALALTPKGRQVLIYAATPDGSSENSDLYIAEKQSGGFLQGMPLSGFNTEDEELEPWVSEDCTVITFRRTARGSEFDGEARKGGTIFQATIE